MTVGIEPFLHRLVHARHRTPNSLNPKSQNRNRFGVHELDQEKLGLLVVRVAREHDLADF